jgi:hypothetical protein
MTGKKSPPREVLVLANSAVAAARTELKAFLSACPSGMVQEVETKLAAEMGSS